MQEEDSIEKLGRNGVFCFGVWGWGEERGQGIWKTTEPGKGVRWKWGQQRR